MLSAVGLTKRYGDATVLDRVDLEVAPGEVHALLGENGAGKSTLIKILSGVVRADAGAVSIDGQRVDLRDARAAQAAGIATLHQELQIVPGLDVAENVLLGDPGYRRFGVVARRAMRARAAELLGLVDQRLDPRRDASELTPVEATMVGIARALSRAARILILDEPTASLTDAETEHLFAAIARLRDQGVGVVYVSHRLAEVKRLCDRYTVLRNGVAVATGAVSEVGVDELITAMAGRPFSALFPPRGTPGETLVRVDGVGARRCRNVSFEVRAGEIVGIAGLAGAGRSELVRILAGVQRPRRGRVVVRGQTIAPHRGGVARAMASGVAMVPQERKAEGVLPDSIARNVNLSRLRALAAGGVVTRPRAESRHAEVHADAMNVRRRTLDQDVFTLSGGNQQKVVLARVLSTEPSVLVLDEPTRGVDVGTKSEIYHLVRARTDAGAAAIVVSSELPELLGWCDRIAVMHEGRLVAVVDAASADERMLLAWCYGHAPAGEPAREPFGEEVRAS